MINKVLCKCFGIVLTALPILAYGASGQGAALTNELSGNEKLEVHGQECVNGTISGNSLLKDGNQSSALAVHCKSVNNNEALSDERRSGFEEALTTTFPMTAEMVRTYRDTYELNEQAIHSYDEPVPILDSKLVRLDNGEDVPTINLSPGIASAIGFFDATGAPWPVQQYVIGDGTRYELIKLGDNANTLTVTPLARVGWTNLIVALAGESIPVVLILRINRTQAHFRSNVQVMKLGPNASNAVGASNNSVLQAGDAHLLAALTGNDMPAQATRIKVSGVNADAWLVDNEILLRTYDQLLSPAWSASLTGPEGIRVYRIAAHSFVLLSIGDRIVRANLELP